MIFDKRYFVAFFSLHSIRCFSHTIVTNVAYAQYNIVKKLTEEKLSQMSIRKNRWAKLDQKKKIDEHKQIGRKTWDEQNRDECLFDIRWADFQADEQLQLLCPTGSCETLLATLYLKRDPLPWASHLRHLSKLSHYFG